VRIIVSGTLFGHYLFVCALEWSFAALVFLPLRGVWWHAKWKSTRRPRMPHSTSAEAPATETPIDHQPGLTPENKCIAAVRSGETRSRTAARACVCFLIQFSSGCRRQAGVQRRTHRLHKPTMQEVQGHKRFMPNCERALSASASAAINGKQARCSSWLCVFPFG